MVRLRAVLFDVDHTLLTEEPLMMLFLPQVYEEISRKSGITKEEARNIFLSEVMRRRGTYEWHDWNFFFRLFNVDLRYEDLLRRYPHKLHVYPDVIPALRRLTREGYLLGVITSGPGYQRLKLKLADLDRYFRVIVTREDVGTVKPDPVMFLYALKEMQVRPEEAVMVGDSLPQDVYGAKNVGMTTAWVNREGEPGHHFPDIEVKNLTELVAYLGRGCLK